jgi:hypothetical protein
VALLRPWVIPGPTHILQARESRFLPLSETNNAIATDEFFFGHINATEAEHTSSPTTHTLSVRPVIHFVPSGWC